MKLKNIRLNIKKRLEISNILMIVIPVIICFFIGLSGLMIIGELFGDKSNAGFADSADFLERAEGTAKRVEEILFDADNASQAKKKHNLDKIININTSSKILVRVYDVDKLYCESGDNGIEIPQTIYKAAESMDNECTIIRGDYCLYAHKIQKDGRSYQMYLTAKTYEPSYMSLKIAIIILLLILIAAVILSVYFTNRFLTRFVFRKIEEPLDILEKGVAQIRDGNLNYKIDYSEDTEFLPVCNAFNEMSRRLKQSVAQTLKNEQSRKELLAGISHDIRSPLTSIQAYVEGLLDGVADSPQIQRKYLLTIKQKSESISNMISQIFIFSKMELEDYPVNIVSADIREEIEKIIFPIAEEYEQKGFKVIIDVQSEILKIDVRLLSSICTNILSNSLKYNQNKIPKIKVYSEIKKKKYILHFADNGEGVDEQALSKLFDVFYRIDPSRNNPGKGSGLGLAIVANAVHRMNGEVRAENLSSGGLDIIVTLPKEGEYE